MHKSKVPLFFLSTLLATSCLATDYSWIGGQSDNSLIDADNWDPSGPPGGNDVGFFATTENPPFLPSGSSGSIGLMNFTASGVVVRVLGDLTVGDVSNDAGAVTIFNIGTAGSLEVDGTLATDGSTIYNLDGAMITIDSTGFSDAAITMQNGSAMSVLSAFALSSLSSTSSSDMIVLDDDLTTGNSEDQIINASFLGSGNLIKEGSGKLTLNGDGSIAGDVRITEGTVAVNGVFDSAFNVLAGTLKGTGTIGSLEVSSGATVAPGNSVGTIQSGPVTFSSGSIFQVEISPTAGSLLDVTGAAVLAGNVDVVQPASTSYPRFGAYRILEATGGITGAFDSTVLGGISGFSFLLSQVGNQVYLLYTTPLIPTSGLSGNALSVANYFNTNGNGSALVLLSNVSSQDRSSALNSVSPARNAFATYVTEQTAFSLSDLLTTHLDDFRIAMGSTASDFHDGLTADNSDAPRLSSKKKQSPWSVWISGFGEYARQSASLQNPSFNYTSEAALAGFDYRAENRGLAGISLGYAHSHFNDNEHAGHGSINYYFASLYGNVFVKDLYFSPAVWGLFNETDNTRNISFTGYSDTAHANIFAWQLVPHLEIGYQIKQGWGDIIPFTSADWAISWQKAYSETGAAPFNANQRAHSSSMVRSETGLKFAEKWDRSWGAFFLREKISYVFEKPYGVGTVNASFVGMPGSFTVTAVDSNLNMGAIGLDFLFAIGKTNPTLLSLSYEGEFGSSYWSSGVQLTLSKGF